MTLRWTMAHQRNAAMPLNASEFIDGVSDQKYDSNIVSYYGTDQKQNFLFIKINRRADKSSELVLFLQLEDGCTYELPDHPNTVVSCLETTTWSAAGLKISVLQSSRRTRILFNGLLRKGNRKDIDDESHDDDVQHVRLNCIFIASTKPYLQKEFWNSNLVSETLKQNSWSKAKWEVFLKHLRINQADQYGSMMAEIMFEDMSTKQLYLRGMRHSQWGKFDSTYFDRNICITATDTLGITFHIRSSNIQNGVKNMQLGHVKNPDDHVHPIESLTFNANRLMDNYNNESNYEFQFSANKRKYIAMVTFCRETEKILYGGNPWNSQYTFCQFELILDNTSGIGMIQIWQPYSGTCNSLNILTLKNSIGRNETCELNDKKPLYVVPFDDPRCQIEQFVGSKGASLAELTAMNATKFTVPKGFCVTVEALSEQIRYHKWLNDNIDELVEMCYSEKKSYMIKEHCKILVVGLQYTTMVESVRNAILEMLGKLESNSSEKKYIVLSSAIEEDNEQTLTAGQNCTFLGVKREDVVKNITYCWSRWYNYQNVQYRQQYRLPIKLSLGVCVQEMINADVAGVMFTRHPVTGNPKDIIITSNCGLGQGIVPSPGDPNTITITRDQKNSLSINSSSIAEKLEKITIIDGMAGSTEHSDESESENWKLSISDELAIKLADIGVTVDQLYNAPRNIEWAVSQSQIYLLQCRSVATLDAWTDFELIHELSSGVPCDSDVFTLANVGEDFPMATTPLTISSIVYGLNVAMNNCYARHFVNDTYKQYIFVANSKCFLNYMTCFLRNAEEKISLGSKLAEIAVCGHSINTPEINEIALRRNGGPAKGLKIIGGIISDFFYKSSMINPAHWETKWRNMTSCELLYKRLDLLLQDFIKVSTIHIHTTKSGVNIQSFILSMLAESNEELSVEYYSDIALLLGSCNNVMSVQIPLELKEITQIIEQSGLSEDFQNIDPWEAPSWLDTHCPQAYQRVRAFMINHGHRGVDEYELSTETWSMKTEIFISLLQFMLDTSIENTRKTSELSPRETVALLKTPRKWSTRWMISKLLSSMRNKIAEREQTKCFVMQLLHTIRMGYHSLAEALVREGRLPEQELVFFITHEELAEIVRAPSPRLLTKAMRRRQIRPDLLRHQYSEISYGFPKPIEAQKLPTSSSGARVEGTPACNGVATGRACIALSFEEAETILPGDILITRTTDIGWSLYFPLLAGVVTELGGLISHSSVIARVYGLPCIVSAENATMTFMTGDIVKLDAYKGTIEVVEDETHEDVLTDVFF